MTLFGLDENDIVTLTRAVRPGRTDRAEDDADAQQQVAGEFARMAWSGITEPGDRTAGLVIAGLGPDHALTALIERWSAARICGSIAEAATQRGTDAEITVEEVEAALARWSPRTRSAAILSAARNAARLGVRVCLPGDDLWPEGLDDLGPHAPIALWWRGRPDALRALHASVALVGARAATGYGEHVAMEAAAGLTDRGFAVVSGAAYGIDGMAHRSALAGKGTTVAFLAGGPDRYYPSGHDTLLTRIAESGAVISELPPGSQPTKWRFLQRNRLIAATAAATVVIEAGWRSGSLNTAGHAAALGRPLGAVPGPVTSAASAGCHRLIREYDAVCVTTAQEMAELVPGYDDRLPSASGADGPTRDATELRLLDALSRRAPRTVDDIAARSGLAPTDVRAALGALGIDGTVRENDRGWLRCG